MAIERCSPERADEVLGYLRHNSVNGETTASIRGIARDLTMGRSTAMRAIQTLLEDGRLEVVRRGTGYLYDSRFRITEGTARVVQGR